MYASINKVFDPFSKGFLFSVNSSHYFGSNMTPNELFLNYSVSKVQYNHNTRSIPQTGSWRILKDKKLMRETKKK